jgi:hypothetical protein
LGTAEFSIQLGTVSFEKELVVAQIDDEVLLGLDILMMGDRGPTELKPITNGDFSIKQGEGSIRNSRAEHKPSIWSIST